MLLNMGKIVEAATSRAHLAVCTTCQDGQGECKGPSAEDLASTATAIEVALSHLLRDLRTEVASAGDAYRNGQVAMGGPDATARSADELLLSWFRCNRDDKPIGNDLHMATVAYLTVQALKDGRTPLRSWRDL